VAANPAQRLAGKRFQLTATCLQGPFAGFSALLAPAAAWQHIIFAVLLLDSILLSGR
jgi:hypothetical protein